MSWSSWPTAGVAPPAVVQGPVINSAPNVVNPTTAASQYTPEQWAQMQQHNWQQWAQWQQQFQQWQQQYGAEYQKSMNAMAQSRGTTAQPTLPYYNMATAVTQPPLPLETKPPPPPDDSHGSQAQQPQVQPAPQQMQQHIPPQMQQHIPSQMQQQHISSQMQQHIPSQMQQHIPSQMQQHPQQPQLSLAQPAVAATANVPSLYGSAAYTQPPPILPGGYTTAPPPPQTAPPKDQFQYNQGQQYNIPPKNQGGFENRNMGDDNQKFGRNVPQNRGDRNNLNWQNQSNRNQQPSYGDNANPQGPGAPYAKGDFGGKRPFNQQYNERGDVKRNRMDQPQTEGNKWQSGNQRSQRWNEPSVPQGDNQNQQWRPMGGNQKNQRWGEQPQSEHYAEGSDGTDNQRQQRWGGSQPDNRQQMKPIQAALKPNIDEPSEAEKKFDKQFADWEAQFQKWKEQNANHPDKNQYKEYEKKWVTWRAQLLERREQMRRKRLGLTGDSSTSSKVSQGSSSVETKLEVSQHELAAQISSESNNPPYSAQQSYDGSNVSHPKVGPQQSYDGGKASHFQVGSQQSYDGSNASHLQVGPQQSHDGSNASHPQIGPQVIPPLMANRNTETSHEGAMPTALEPTGNEQSVLTTSEPSVADTNKETTEHEPEKTSQTEDGAAGFLKAPPGDGIPGLDLVEKEGEEKEGDTVEEEQKKKPDLEAISRGINSILGDQNLMNMLSMVSQAQPSQATISNALNTTVPGVSDSPKFSPNPENDEYSNQGTYDDQSQSSLNVTNEPEKSALIGSKNFNITPDSRGQEFSGGSDNLKNSADGFGKGLSGDNFNRGSDNSYSATDNIGRGPNNLGGADNFNQGSDNFIRGRDNFQCGPDSLNQETDLNRGLDNFGRGTNPPGRDFDSFNRGPNAFNRGLDVFKHGADSFNPDAPDHGFDASNRGADAFNRGSGAFNRGFDAFNRGPNALNRGPDVFNRGPEAFKRGPDSFNRGPDSFNRGPDNFNRGQGDFKRGPDNFPTGQDGFNPDRLSGKPRSVSKGPPSLLDIDFSKGPGNFLRGSGNFGKETDNFNKGRDNISKGAEFGRGWESENSRRGSDEFNRESFSRGPDNFRGGPGGFNKRGGGNIGRGGRDNFNRIGGDFNRQGPEFNRGGENNFQRGGSDIIGGGPDNFGRGADGFNRGGFDNFNRGADDVIGGPSDSFHRDKFNRSADRFSQGSGDYNQEPENFNRLAHEFDRGPEGLNNSLNLGKRGTDVFDAPGAKDLNFQSLGGFRREMKNFQNKPIEGSVIDPVVGPELLPSSWDKANLPPTETGIPPEPERKEEGMWKPSTVIDYEHKTLKPVEPEVMLAPVYMFDYRHKLLSRIPFPQRPKWLSDIIKNFPEFDPPIGRQFEPPISRQFEPQHLKRFSGKDPLDRDRKLFDDRDRRFDERDRKSFDDRDWKSYGERDRKLHDTRDRKSFDDGDRKLFDDRDRKSFEGRDRKFLDDDSDRKSFDDRDRKSFEGRDKIFFDDKDRRSFEDRKFFDDRDRDRKYSDDRDRKPYGEKDRKQYDDRDRKFYDERDRKRFDERDRKSYGSRDEDSKTFGRKSDDDRTEELHVGSKKSSNSDDLLEEGNHTLKIKGDSSDNKNKSDSNKQDNKNVSNTVPGKSSVTLVEDLLSPPGRFNRPPRIVIILRGPPGSGKSHLAKIIKDKEVENGGSAPRIICLDDYFMVEQDKEIDEDGKKVKVKEMVYEYEECMEASYRQSLMKSFKKTITDGYFSFIIVDNVNDKVKYFGEMWSFAKQNGFQVYICEMDLDVQACTKRNIHGRSEIEIERCVAGWEPTPSHHPILDASSLIQTETITEVEMEEVDSPPSVEENVEEHSRSKWDTFDYSVDNLAKLDGISKPLRPSRTMEDFLQLDEWTEPVQTKPGQKRVRWADLEEHKKQEKMRAIGFVVGHTNWDRMMDPTMGSSALTQTKYIERYK